MQKICETKPLTIPEGSELFFSVRDLEVSPVNNICFARGLSKADFGYLNSKYYVEMLCIKLFTCN